MNEWGRPLSCGVLMDWILVLHCWSRVSALFSVQSCIARSRVLDNLLFSLTGNPELVRVGIFVLILSLRYICLLHTISGFPPACRCHFRAQGSQMHRNLCFCFKIRWPWASRVHYCAVPFPDTYSFHAAWKELFWVKNPVFKMLINGGSWIQSGR